MKRIIISFIIISFFLFSFKAFNFVQITNGNKGDVCNQNELLKRCRKMLGQYDYDSFEYSKINFQKKPQTSELEVPMFSDESYILIFNTRGLKKKVAINIYNKNINAKVRDLLFSNAEVPDTQTEFKFEPTGKIRKLYVDYVVPAIDTDTVPAGCLMWVLGYQ